MDGSARDDEQRREALMRALSGLGAGATPPPSAPAPTRPVFRSPASSRQGQLRGRSSKRRAGRSRARWL